MGFVQLIPEPDLPDKMPGASECLVYFNPVSNLIIASTCRLGVWYHQELMEVNTMSNDPLHCSECGVIDDPEIWEEHQEGCADDAFVGYGDCEIEDCVMMRGGVHL